MTRDSTAEWNDRDFDETISEIIRELSGTDLSDIAETTTDSEDKSGKETESDQKAEIAGVSADPTQLKTRVWASKNG